MGIKMIRIMNIIRQYSSNAKELFGCHINPLGGRSLVEAVAVAKNGKTIVAWHPDPVYPYEFTKLIPKNDDVQTVSLLTDEALCTAMSAFKSKRPEIAREELMRLTHTTKHCWFPRSRDKRAKKTPMDRSYL